MDLVAGATGYIGERLIERLASDGRRVRALARDPARVPPLSGVEPVAADLARAGGLDGALEGVTTAYYLVHSMEVADDDDFAERDRRMARRFGDAARRAEVERIVYLGGMAPDGRVSTHLGSRLEVEQILLDAVPESTALRASVVIGARSSSFRVLVRLVERLPVLPMPGWGANRTQPIDERDVVEYLARTPTVPAACGRALDVVGPDVLSYGEMMERIAELMGVGRTSLAIGASLTSPASALVAALTGQPLALVRPLMESLGSNILPRDPEEAARLYGLRPRRFDRAVEHALAEWEAAEALGAR